MSDNIIDTIAEELANFPDYVEYDVSASTGSGVVRIVLDDLRHTTDAARKLAAEILAAAEIAERVTAETTTGEGK